MTDKIKLTPKQRAVLAEIIDSGVSGYCARYVWTYTVDGKPETRAVKALTEKGALAIGYLSGDRLSYRVTDEGKAAMA